MKRLWTGERIIQIIPAVGWHARYRLDNGGYSTSPLQCFALVERTYPNAEPEQSVHGMDADESGHMEFADSAQNFAGYVHVDSAEFKLADGRPRV